MIKKLIIKINTADKDHCSNDCPHIDIWPADNNYTAICNLFTWERLFWDTKRKTNGYQRCKQCKKAEIG